MKDRTRYQACLTLLRLLIIMGLIGMPSMGWGKEPLDLRRFPDLNPTSEWMDYTDNTYGWSIQYPFAWSIATEFENPLDSGDQVIKKRVGIYGEERATIWIDIYTNRTGMSLENWFATYKQPLLSSKPEQTIRINGVLNGNPAVLAVDDQDKTAVRQVALVALHENFAVAITYLVLDGGLARDKFHSLLNTFRWADSPIQSAQQQLTAISKLDEILLSAQPAAANCCGINSPGNICICCTRDADGKEVGNCVWWACHTRRDVGCAGNASTWAACARQRGKTVNTTPAAGALVTWNTENHIAYVESVNNDGSINISEMDCYSSRACGGTTGYNGVNRRTVSALGKSFIHGDSPPQCNDSRNPEGGFTSPNNNQQVTDSVNLKGWARDDCNINYVEFTATWPGKGWHVLQRLDADCGGGQSCDYNFNWNLSNVPDGWVTLGYDVYDKSGKKVLSPNGTRQIRKVGRCGGPNLQLPESGFRTKSMTVMFRWQTISCEHSGFKIRIKTNSDMNSGGEIVAEQDVNGTEATFSFDSQRINQSLYWSVRADNTPVGAEWSPAREFKLYDEPPTISFNTANGNSADTINSRDQNWTFNGTASDPEGKLNRVEFVCSGDSCNAQESLGANGNWSYTRNGLTGENRIRFKACDEKQQCTDSRTVTLRIDLAAPTTKAELSGQKAGDWYNSAVTVKFHSDDGATGNARVGVDKIFYRLDGGGWQSGGGQDVTFTANQDGAHTVEYYAVDGLGNQEATKSISFKVDATPPSPPSNASELNGVVNGQWQKAVGAPPAPVPVFQWQTGNDATSGLFQQELYFGEKADGTDISMPIPANAPSTWTPLPAGVRTGTWYLRARARDKANNVSDWVTLFTFRYDNTPPANPATATHDANIANNTWQRTSSVPNFTWTPASDEGSGLQGYRLYWGGDSNGQADNLSPATTYQTASPLCAADQACIGYLRIRSVDNVNNEAAAWGTLFTLKYDGLPPTLDLKVNNGVTYTAQTLVTLNLNGVDEHSGLREMRFSHDGVVWTPWEAYATEKIWQIPAIGRQSWPVYAQVRDGVGNESAVSHQEVYFEVNRQQPQSASYRLFDSLNSAGVGSHTSTSYQGASTVGQVVDAARTGSDNYRITGGYQAGSQAIPLVIPGHDEFTFINGVFASGVVVNTMQSASYAMLATVGEVGLPNNTTTLNSASYQHQPGFLAAVPAATHVVPTPVPTPGPTPLPEPTPDCEFAIASVNDGALFTNSPAVTLKLCAPRVQQMIVSNDGGFGGAQWETYARQKPWTITTYGQQVLPRQVYVKYRDEKNVIQTASDDIIYDPTAPSGQLLVNSPISPQVVAAAANEVQAASADGVFVIAGTTYLRQVNGVALAQPLPLVAPKQSGASGDGIDLYLIAQDDNSGMARMQLSENADFSGASWQAYAGLVEYNPSGDDGVKTLYARFLDHANNVSAATEAGFVLDSQPPLGGMSVVEQIVGPHALTVTLYLQAEDNLSGVDAMRISARESFTDAVWQPMVSNLVWPIYLIEGQSSGSLFVQFRDKIGNVSQSYQTDYLVDAQPPIIYAETVSSTDLTRTLSLYAYDELSTLRDLYLTNDPLFSEGITRQPYTDTVSWTFDERHVVWIKVADSVGNLSDAYPLYAAGIEDTPVLPTENKLYLPVVNR